MGQRPFGKSLLQGFAGALPRLWCQLHEAIVKDIQLLFRQCMYESFRDAFQETPAPSGNLPELGVLYILNAVITFPGRKRNEKDTAKMAPAQILIVLQFCSQKACQEAAAN